MKKYVILIFINFLFLNVVFGQNLKPYILATSIENGSVSKLTNKVKQDLNANGFEVLGSYNPMESSKRSLIAVTHPKLIAAVKKVGGLTGFASALRVAITKEGNYVKLSYTNPAYWGRAYFTGDYTKVEGNYKLIQKAFDAAFNSYGTTTSFGSEDGLSKSKLAKYHYMLGMPYFEDNVELAEFSNYNAAVAHIDNNLKKGVAHVTKVYEVNLPGKKIKLYGIGLKGPDGEGSFMPVIDAGNPKHTAFLPYELLVYNNKAYMLHGRFRIALSFPDLSMGTFMKIVSTPGNIESLLGSVCK